MNWTNLLLNVLYVLPGIVIGLTVHEFMHAFVAARLGDTTARDQGRLTLNPLRHVDPVGLLFLLIAGFGWAKPVQINRAALRHPRRDDALISFSGPAANLVTALLLSVLFWLASLVAPVTQDASGNLSVFWLVFFRTITINYALFIFNLLPIPPLDGSHLLFAIIKVSPETEAKMYRYGATAFLGLLIASLFLQQVVGFGLFDWIQPLVLSIAIWVLRLFGMGG
jgi:Zn-dependent protease